MHIKKHNTRGFKSYTFLVKELCRFLGKKIAKLNFAQGIVMCKVGRFRRLRGTGKTVRYGINERVHRRSGGNRILGGIDEVAVYPIHGIIRDICVDKGDPVIGSIAAEFPSDITDKVR